MPRSSELPSRRWLAGLLWLVVLAGATWLFLTLRDRLGFALPAIGYLLVVLVGSSRLGRAWGVALAVLAFLCFNFFLVPPYYTLAVLDAREWLVLVGFLLTGIVAAQLLDRAQREARAAQERAHEVDRFSTIGAEALSAGRAEQGVQAIARVLLERLGLSRCAIYQRLPESDEVVLIAAATSSSGPADVPAEPPLAAAVARGAIASEPAEGPVSLIPLGEGLASALGAAEHAQGLTLPLQVRRHTVGFLLLQGERPLNLDGPARRFTEALAYYAALGVERVRLVAEAERAAAFREADRLKDALLASVSHDLRTPLTTIKALAREIRDDGDARAAVVEEETDRLNRYVSNLLDLSRLNSGAIPVSPEIVPAEELLGSALEQIAGVCGDATVVPSLPPADDLLLGRFDFVLALRALVNLLENACKYAGAHPIELGVRREADTLLFSVGDRGPGVAAADRERIFEPFVRGHPGADAVRHGAGLGLSIARQLARLQGGDVTHAPREGGGSTFTLALPAAELPPPEE